jgi:hypothetical protein
MGLTNLPLVVLVWDDAWVKGDAPVVMSEVKHEHKPMPVTTIGWLLHEDDRGVQIANEFYDDAYRGRTFVPRAMVRSMTTYALAKPRQPRRPKAIE